VAREHQQQDQQQQAQRQRPCSVLFLLARQQLLLVLHPG
jgi:hypothetical protein